MTLQVNIMSGDFRSVEIPASREFVVGDRSDQDRVVSQPVRSQPPLLPGVGEPPTFPRIRSCHPSLSAAKRRSPLPNPHVLARQSLLVFFQFPFSTPGDRFDNRGAISTDARGDDQTGGVAP